MPHRHRVQVRCRGAGFPPTDGPDTYTAGTLFPRSSKKAARAINAASGNRPVVVLANLSGFDGSPESMRSLQLEYGAEIGRAIVNFDGPIVFAVVSRYHGGAFVVFSKALNPRMTVLAVEGSFASVIGGAPAAAVVFSRDVDARTGADPRVADARGPRWRAAEGAERAAARDRARRAALVGARREARRGRLRVRRGAQHPPGGRGRLGRRGHRAAELRPRIIAALEAGSKEGSLTHGQPTGDEDDDSTGAHRRHVRAATEGTPYLVEERPYGFDLTINIVDATWWTLLRKSSVKRVFTHQVRLDEDSQRMTVTDVAQSVRWDAGAGLGSPPSLHVEQQVQRGRVYEFSSEKQWGLDAETGQAGKVVDYTFSAKEGRDLVRGVADRDGWSEAMGAEARRSVSPWAEHPGPHRARRARGRALPSC